jgi:uncharacterized membrane protein
LTGVENDRVNNDAPHGAVDDAKQTARLETFADGVFAIAITLLVLEIKIPEAGEDLTEALLAQWPSFAAYVTSFLGIGVIWVSHHQMFAIIHRTTPTFLFLNVLFLLPVAFIPYPTAVVAQHIQEPGSGTVAVVLYGAVSTTVALMFNVLWAYAIRANLVGRGAAATAAQLAARGFRLGPFIYLGATLISLVSPLLSMGLFAVFAVYWMLPGRIPGE